MLRHTVATLAYRGKKALIDAPADFAAFRAGPATRTPAGTTPGWTMINGTWISSQ